MTESPPEPVAEEGAAQIKVAPVVTNLGVEVGAASITSGASVSRLLSCRLRKSLLRILSQKSWRFQQFRRKTPYRLRLTGVAILILD